MFVSYKCKKCNEILKKNVDGKIPLSITCPNCNQQAIRTFGNVSFDAEDDNITGAMQMMLYSSNPSGKQESIV